MKLIEIENEDADVIVYLSKEEYKLILFYIEVYIFNNDSEIAKKLYKELQKHD